jgi:hypothetical protein
MPARVRRSKKGKTTVFQATDGSKVFGTHKTKKAAIAQIRAINISMGLVPGVKPRKRKKK